MKGVTMEAVAKVDYNCQMELKSSTNKKFKKEDFFTEDKQNHLFSMRLHNYIDMWNIDVKMKSATKIQILDKCLRFTFH